jgi:hypothetical protein
MEVVQIDPTEITPRVELNKAKGLFLIQGRCLPEDVKSFFLPVIEWFESYLTNPNDDTKIILDFEYFNTASSKMILIILSKLRDLQKCNKRVQVIWKYPQYDAELEEAGEEFSDLLNIPFEFVPKVEQQ